jgi:hypothetical protein
MQHHIRKESRNAVHGETNLLANRNKNSDIVEFFIFKELLHNCLDIKPNLEIVLENTSKIVTLVRQLPPESRNNKTNRRTFRNEIEENLLLNIPLKTAEGIEQATAAFNNVVQTAVWSATPDRPQAECQEYP